MMDRRTLLKTLAAAIGGLTVSAHHRPGHEKGPKTTTTTTTTLPPTTTSTVPTTTTTVPATTTTTLRPTGDPIYADRTHRIDPGENWQTKINGA